MTSVPCVHIGTMTEAQKRAYVIADNKLALNAGWDDEILAEELKALRDVEISFDVELTGFSIAEVDSLVEGPALEEKGDPRADARSPLDHSSTRCHVGDVRQLGLHRLVCGNALDPAVVETLMDGDVARMVFTDPRNNVPVQGFLGGAGNVKHREFALASGEMTNQQFISFLASSFSYLQRHSCDGSIHFVCMDFGHIRNVIEAADGIYTELKNLCVWVKDNGGMGTFYGSRHELVFVFKNGTAEHVNSFELGRHGRYRTNVWEYRGANTLKAGRMDGLAMHPTVKPVDMIADAIKDCSARGEIILDLFGAPGPH